MKFFRLLRGLGSMEALGLAVGFRKASSPGTNSAKHPRAGQIPPSICPLSGQLWAEATRRTLPLGFHGLGITCCMSSGTLPNFCLSSAMCVGVCSPHLNHEF